MLVALVAVALGAVCAPASAQDYPTRTISLMVPFAAGGPTDTVARALAISMGNTLKQTIIVENVVGAGGTIAPAKLKSANPDGYSLMLAHIGMSTAPSLYRTLPFKPIEDFEHIGQVVDVPMTFIAKKDLPPNDFKGLIDYMKANKDKVTLANAGVGAASHLCGLLFMSAIQTDVTTVPYKGTAPAMTDLLGGQVDLMCDQTTNTSGQIETGKVKAYAVTTTKRLTTPALKNLPTLDEAGLKGFNVSIWHALYAPKGTPKAVVDKVNSALRVALKDPDFIKREEALGAVVVTDNRLGGAEHKKFVEAEINKWGPVIKAAGQYAD